MNQGEPFGVPANQSSNETSSCPTSVMEDRGTHEGGSTTQQDVKQQGQALRDEAVNVAGRAAGQAQHTLENAAASVQQSARAAGNQAAQAASQTAERLKQECCSALSQQKERAADELSHLSGAMRRAADSLHQEQDDAIASYAEAAAESIESASRYLRESELGRLVDDTEAFARRRPELFYGGMFLAGLAISRFLKASRRNDDFNLRRDEYSRFQPAPYGDYTLEEMSYGQQDL